MSIRFTKDSQIIMAFENGDIVMLMEDTQLRKLADVLHKKEEALMDAISSEPDRAKYMNECKEANDIVISLLNKCNELNEKIKQGTNNAKASTTAVSLGIIPDVLKYAIDMTMDRARTLCLRQGWASLAEKLEYEINALYGKFINSWKKYHDISINHDSDETNNTQGSELTKAVIAQAIQDYVKYGINISLQCVRDCCLRKRWLRRIEIHFEILVWELENMNVQNLDNMAEDVSLYKQCMWEYGSNCRGGLGQVKPKTYLKLVDKEGIQFSDLVDRKKNELGFADELDSLTEAQQVQVYASIINESSEANSEKMEEVTKKTTNVQFVEFIFGKEGKTIPDLIMMPAFHSAEMPDGMILACRIAYPDS